MIEHNCQRERKYHKFGLTFWKKILSTCCGIGAEETIMYLIHGMHINFIVFFSFHTKSLISNNCLKSVGQWFFNHCTHVRLWLCFFRYMWCMWCTCVRCCVWASWFHVLVDVCGCSVVDVVVVVVVAIGVGGECRGLTMICGCVCHCVCF